MDLVFYNTPAFCYFGIGIECDTHCYYQKDKEYTK